jgi:hypothetical protein
MLRTQKRRLSLGAIAVFVFASFLVVCPYLCSSAQAIEVDHSCCPEMANTPVQSESNSEESMCCEQHITDYLQTLGFEFHSTDLVTAAHLCTSQKLLSLNASAKVLKIREGPPKCSSPILSKTVLII